MPAADRKVQPVEDAYAANGEKILGPSSGPGCRARTDSLSAAAMNLFVPVGINVAMGL
jgi:hypothetical protein